MGESHPRNQGIVSGLAAQGTLTAPLRVAGEPAPQSRRVLVITGMNRSGTSLVAHYLNQCGLDIGERLLMPNFGTPRILE